MGWFQRHKFAWWWDIVWLLAGCLVLLAAAAIAVRFLSQQALTTAYNVVGAFSAAVTVVIALSVTTSWVQRKYRSRQRADGERERQELVDKLHQLSEGHPELVSLADILTLDQKARQQESDRRSFWGSMLQNFVFFGLGVVTPLLIAHIGFH